MHFAAQSIQKTYADLASDHTILVQAHLHCAETYGLDQLSVISDPYRETTALGGEVDYLPTAPPSLRSYPLANVDDPARHLQVPDFESSPRTRDRLDALRLFRAQTRDHYSILGWVEGPAALASTLKGPEDFLLDLLDEPEKTADLLEACTEVAIAFALKQLEAGADTIGIGDAIASQASPQLYETLILPREKHLISAIQKAGGLARLHICGNTTHLLPGMATLNCDLIDLDHAVDLAHARQILGPQPVLTGNLDPVHAIERSTPEAIRTSLRECARAAGPRYMVNAGCEIPAATPHENLHALCEPLTP